MDLCLGTATAKSQETLGRALESSRRSTRGTLAAQTGALRRAPECVSRQIASDGTQARQGCSRPVAVMRAEIALVMVSPATVSRSGGQLR